MSVSTNINGYFKKTLMIKEMYDTTYELQCHNDNPVAWSIFLGYKVRQYTEFIIIQY